MAILTNNQIVNTATILNQGATVDSSQFPFLSGLRYMGMDAVLRDGQIGLIPPAKVTQRMLEVARQNRLAIVAEIENLYALYAADRAADATINFQATRWSDPLHNLDEVENLISRMFLHCHKLGWPTTSYWDGDPLPQPAQRPYCYVQAWKLNDEYKYFPVIADVDGTDYLWVEVVINTDN